ncbi:MAG: hypothetical protein RLZZ200_2752 [Pseudomonadota bacterium]
MALGAVLWPGSLPLQAADRDEPVEVSLRIRDHRFEPEVVEVPAGRRVKLVIHNEDSTVEEFESYSLGREKLVAGGSSITVFVGPLKAGEYDFFGEYHQETANGRLVAR